MTWRSGDTVELMGAESTAYFVDLEPEGMERLAQILRLTLRTRPGAEITITVDDPAPIRVTDDRRLRLRVIDVPIEFNGPPPEPGDTVRLNVIVSTSVSSATAEVPLLVHEPGRTIHLIPHFHMDPVWWNTQASTFDELDRFDWSGSPRMQFQRSVIDILRTHIDRAEDDPEYRFCVAEVDYLAPLWTHHLEDRERLRRLLADGRAEVVGATYNEPNGTLTSAELSRRNLDMGTEFQRDVLGQRADTSWQLDVFGHDPQFPSLLADAGVETIVFARGPFGAWGPMLDGGFSSPADPGEMQFPTEFEWIAPDGRSVIAAYLAAHYSSGFRIDGYDTIEEAAEFLIGVGTHLGNLAASSHVQMLVGTDLSPPARWITELPGWFAARYAWPKVRCSLPSDFIGAMRDELAGRPLSPQSRDMNPVYTGKDVSYIDTKQAQREIENTLVDAELWSTVASSRHGVDYPANELDEAWRLLVYGAHHDAITGTESDQAYLELLAGWRRAHALAHTVKSRALDHLHRRDGTLDVGTDHGSAALTVTVFDATIGARTDAVRVVLDRDHLAALDPNTPSGLTVLSQDGDELPFVVDVLDVDETSGATISIALRVLVATSGIGRTTLRVIAAPDRALPRWEHRPGTTIENRHHRLTVDPQRGGCVTSWRALDDEMMIEDRLGNEFVVHDEYPNHPTHGEGPWHLSPTGTTRRSSDRPAKVRCETSPIGERLVIDASLPTAAMTNGESDARVRSTLTLLAGVDRVDVGAVIDDPDLRDELVRVEWAAAVPGATPVVEVGEAVVGRGFAFTDVDAALHAETLDTAATNWFGSSVTARVDLVADCAEADAASPVLSHAIGIGEVVTADWSPTSMSSARRLVVALGAAGVTATTTSAAGRRYGRLGFDSNAPDLRIALGEVGANSVAEAALRRLPTADRSRIDRNLADTGSARAWTPAIRPLTDVWQPGLDVTNDDDLPVLTVIAVDAAALERELDALIEELAVHRITVESATTADPAGAFRPPWPGRTVAVANTGTPSCAVTTDGVLSCAIMRSSTGWPSGQWIEPPRRTVPDGSSFQLQHWTHAYNGALFARDGDWRRAAVVRSANDLQHPLDAVVTVGMPAPDDPCDAGADTNAHNRPDQVLGADVDVDVEGSGTPILRSVSVVRPGVARVRLGNGTGTPSRHRVRLAGLPGQPGATGTDLDTGPFRTDEMTLPLLADLAIAPRPDAEPTPVFSRWWSQGRGPLQRRHAPVAIRIHPLGRRDDGQIEVDLVRLTDPLMTLSPRESGCEPLDVEVQVIAGDRVVSTATEAISAGAGRTATYSTECSGDRAPGGIRVIARGRHADGSRWAVYDEVHRTRAAPVVLASDPASIRVLPGRRATAEIRVENHGDLSAWVELDVLCPWGTWTMTPPRHEATVPPHDTCVVTVEFSPPVDAPTGAWWWGVRLVAGPTVAYSPTADIEIVGSNSAE
ncbi:putative alpha-mannosidase [Ilumatobacter coccineus YM16-304]|uniref:Putative alpha-mannosidase n=2 Tax=Ilumatobacter coccineus TaxID=467094 RepID=A0A6C7E0X2_ILUCY|nr:putative alpha-mannosidase [Ilumatobacter coccineus YM16-304]